MFLAPKKYVYRSIHHMALDWPVSPCMPFFSVTSGSYLHMSEVVSACCFHLRRWLGSVSPALDAKQL